MAGTTTTVAHRRIDVDGVDIFYREAGPPEAPVLLLPHGYPCSSYEFRDLMPRLAHRWHLLAPDFPGCGYSATPDGFAYTFDGYAEFLHAFCLRLGVRRPAIWLHDFGSQIGLRFAIAHPEIVSALVIQNGDIYEDQLGLGYAGLRDYWADPSPVQRARLAQAVSEDGFREEFLNDLPEQLRDRVAPDLWHLHWSLVTPRRREILVDVIAGLRENLSWFPRYQAYLRDHQPPTLVVWGCRDRYMPAGAGLAYRRDLPDARIHLLEDAGHWPLETHPKEVAALTDDFLQSVMERS